MNQIFALNPCHRPGVAATRHYQARVGPVEKIVKAPSLVVDECVVGITGILIDVSFFNRVDLPVKTVV